MRGRGKEGVGEESGKGGKEKKKGRGGGPLSVYRKKRGPKASLDQEESKLWEKRQQI